VCLLTPDLLPPRHLPGSRCARDVRNAAALTCQYTRGRGSWRDGAGRNVHAETIHLTLRHSGPYSLHFYAFGGRPQRHGLRWAISRSLHPGMRVLPSLTSCAIQVLPNMLGFYSCQIFTRPAGLPPGLSSTACVREATESDSSRRLLHVSMLYTQRRHSLLQSCNCVQS
jgi:hypothetical protein